MEEEKQEQKQENEKQEQEQTAPKKEKQEDENEFTNYYEEERRLLRKALREKKLVVFVGSGTSKKSGIPLWDEAVKEYAKGIRFFSENKYEGNLKIPQMYFNARGRKEYVELSRQVFCFDKNLQPNEIHEILISIGIRKFITTNYDNLLEKEAQKQKVIYEVIAKDEDIPYKREEREIIKMHGDFLCDNFVLKEDDYLNYSENFKLMETYIKAVIASNVVLFVGYSFNDPDTKQIFNWIKSILKEDFQRAYMLEVSEQYDPNNEEYYKNLGVNVIYAANLLKKFKKKDEQKKEDKEADKKEEKEDEKDNLNGKPYECTVKMLDYLLQREEKQKPIEEKTTEEKTTEELIDDLYCELLPFSKFNVVWYQNVNKILRKYNFDRYYVEADKDFIIVYHKNENIVNMFLNILDENNKNDKIALIRKVLYSAGIKRINIFPVELTDKSDINQIPFKRTKSVCNEDDFYCFDFEALLKDAQKIKFKQNKDDIEYYIKSYMKVAYINYFMGDFAEAYRIFKQISFEAYEFKEYTWFFIAKMNQRYTGLLANGTFYPLSEELRNVIYPEAKEIDLDLEYNKLPVSFYKNNDPLKELYIFSITYNVFQYIIKLKADVENKSQINYIRRNIENMRDEMKRYYEYIMFNYISTDRFIQNIDIFRQYIKAVFQCYKTETGKIDIGDNIINSFELFIMISYFSWGDIENILSDFDIEQIYLDKDGYDYIKTVCENFFKQYKENNEINEAVFFERFTIFFTLTSVIPFLEPDTVEKILEMLQEKLRYFLSFGRKIVLTNFLYTQYENKSLMVESKQLSELLKKLIEEWKKDIEAPPEREELTKEIEWVIYRCTNIFKEIQTPIFYELNKDFFQDKKYTGILISVYKFCDDSLKEKIKPIIIETLKNETISSLYDYVNWYSDVLIELKILDADKNIENKILQMLDNYKTCNKNVNDFVLEWLFLLLMNNKLIRKDKFIPYLKNQYGNFVDFVIDMKAFDYSQFKLEWFYKIKKSNKKLIKEISKNETARKSIINLFQKEGKQGALSKELQEIYFKHFC